MAEAEYYHQRQGKNVLLGSVLLLLRGMCLPDLIVLGPELALDLLMSKPHRIHHGI